MVRKILIGMTALGLSYVVACGSEGNSTFGEGGGTSSGSSGNNSPFSSGGPGGDGGSSGSSGGPACATGESSAARQPVYIDIILDGSRSMDGHASTSAG